MANSYDFTGDEKDYFMKSSWQVYTDLNGNRQYVGKTGNEKTISPSLETIEWMDNTSGVQTRFILDIDRFDFDVRFTFMQVADPNALALAMNADLDSSDPNINRLFLGSAPNALQDAEWRFVGQTRSGLGITLVLRKAICIMDGEWTSGAPGEYTNIPVKVSALQDTSITDTKRDLAYFEIDKRSDS
jgi:hypothetical protein